MAQLTVLPGMDRFNRVLGCRETFLAQIIREALSLACLAPSILTAFQADIDDAAKEAKKGRLMDEIWRAEALPRFPGFLDSIDPSDFDSVHSSTFALFTGRPRSVEAELLLVLLVVDGVFSLTSVDGYERLVGSEVFQALVGDRRTPALSTVGKYLGLVSAETREKVHKALYALVRDEGLDTFEELTVDSTAIEANTAWPSESALICGFLRRGHRLLQKQAEYTDVHYQSKLVERWLKEMDGLHREIGLLPSRPGSVAERKRLYSQLLVVAEKTRRKLRELLNRRQEEIIDCCIRPTWRLRVDDMLQRIDDSLDEADRAMASARQRVLLGQSVPASEKVFSLADPDAYMIVKGQRDPVVGYRPQIGRSTEGFISCFEVNAGNPADSERLMPMFHTHCGNTGQKALAVSTDDGYTSADNLKQLSDEGVQVVSFSGAKGRRLLGDDIYELDACSLLRSERSSVESTIFTFKHKMGMRRFCRRGLRGVQADLSSAVLAYNLWRLSYVRRRNAEGVSRPPLQQAA